MNKSLIIKNTNKCNLKCWYCSTCGEETMPAIEVMRRMEAAKDQEVLLIGGEPMVLSPAYYLQMLDAGFKFSMQSNLTLYTEDWNAVLTHPNFTGLSVSGDKVDGERFAGLYNQVAAVVGYKPLVLIVLDKTFFDSRQKGLLWAETARVQGFPLKVNYLLPTGLLEGRSEAILKLSAVFHIYTELLGHWWRSGRSYELQPMQDIFNALTGKAGNICPYLPDCISKDVMTDVEPDGSEYPCPVLGDLKKQKADIRTEEKASCLVCDHFAICRGCNIRNWVVQGQNDFEEYCASAGTFFTELKRIAEENNVAA